MRRCTGRCWINQPLRICLVSAAYHPYPSGVSEHVSQLAGSLKALGHDVQVLTTNFPGDWDDQAETVPVTRFGRVLLLPMNRSYTTLPVGLNLARDVKRFLAEHDFDIVHCHGLVWPEISYWALRYSRAVNVVSFLAAGFHVHRRGGRTLQWLFRGLLSRIDGLVPISQRARDAFAAYVPGEYRIIPCGIDLNRFRPGLAPLPDRDPSRPTILFLGRLDARKGIRVLLQAMPLVLDRLPAVRLVVVGKGPEERAARRLTARLGIESSVVFVGPAERDALPRYYCGADVFCSPTLGGETLGIVLLEAMASGTPVVASNIPGYNETVRSDRDGILVPPAQPAALAEALLKPLETAETRCRLVEAGLARARQYTWPEIARRTEAYYRELIERRRASATPPAPSPVR